MVTVGYYCELATSSCVLTSFQVSVGCSFSDSISEYVEHWPGLDLHVLILRQTVHYYTLLQLVVARAVFSQGWLTKRRCIQVGLGYSQIFSVQFDEDPGAIALRICSWHDVCRCVCCLRETSNYAWAHEIFSSASFSGYVGLQTML